MHLPAWAQPLTTPHNRRCQCVYAFTAIARVTCKVLGHTFKYDLCPVCLVYERELRGELTYAFVERITRYLTRALLDRGDYYVPEPPAPKPAPTRYRRRVCPECGKTRRYPIDSLETRCEPCRASERKERAYDQIAAIPNMQVPPAPALVEG